MPKHDLTLYASWRRVSEDAPLVPFDFEERDGGVVITGYTGESGTVSVPARINGLPVTEIADRAFAGNDYVRTVWLRASVTRIGEEAFAGSTLYDIEMDGVTSIGARAFDGCGVLAKVAFGRNLTEMGAGAFRGCDALLVAELPERLTQIPEDAFFGCTWLTNVTLPSGLETIAGNAFGGCANLKAIQIGASVREIAPDAFDGCTSLAEIAVAGENAYYKEDSGALLNRSGTQLLLYPRGRSDGEFAVPDGVTGIADGAMQGARLKSLKLNAQLTTIGANALRGCTFLESVEFDGALTTIGANAFDGCVNLTDVTLPEGVTKVGDEAFAMTGLARIYVPANAQLGRDAIPERSGLTIYGHRGSDAETYAKAHGIRFVDESSDVPVTGIELSAEALELEPGQTATLTATLTPGETTETEVTWSSSDEAVAVVNSSGEVEARGIGSATVSAMAANGATAECALTVARKPVKASEIKLSAEAIELNLGDMCCVTATVLPAGADDGAVSWEIEETSIAEWFRGCVIGKALGMTTLTATTAGGLSATCSIRVVKYDPVDPMDAPDFALPASLKSIEAEAFAGLAMRVVSCPKGLREIGSCAFANCSNLKQIYIPASVTAIAEDAFDGCGDGLVIYGTVGSQAEQFARAQGYKFGVVK